MRTRFILWSISFCWVSAPLTAFSAERPNVLWIIGEDMGPELSCYGTTEVWTPNLDRLASQGMRYTRAFSTAPVCSASRSAFMTGMYQTTIGAHNHRSHREDGFRLPEGVRLITEWARDAGYYTANVRQINSEVRGTGKTDWNFTPPNKPFDGDDWADLSENQPFFAQVNFSEAHRGSTWPEARRNNERLADPAKVVIPPYYPDHPTTRDDWANYLDSITQLDRKVGAVLSQLAEDGLADNTAVFVFGDHGRCMVRGKQWCYDSGLHIPLIIYWPSSLPKPDHYSAGTVSDQLISAIDISATTLAIAGVSKPEKMEGRIFLGKNAEPAREAVISARDRCDETVFRIRSVRDKKYRYIRNFMPERPFLQLNRYKETSYPVVALMRQLHGRGELTPAQEVLMAPHRPAEELYDLENDPYEIDNLAESPQHAEIMANMQTTLSEWIAQTGDQGQYPEPAEILEHWEKRQKENYERKQAR